MYTRYFGLSEKPFAIAPDPKYLYMSDAHREALAHLLYGLNGDGCIILFTGDIGTGKTTACRCLLEQLPSNTDIAIILNPKLSILDILHTICEELKIPVTAASPSIKTYTDHINEYLLEAYAQNRTTTLIIDEAQNLDATTLEHLRLLTNLETNTRKLLQIILIGQPELRNTLDDPGLEQISQRVTTRFHLGPLKKQDVQAYIKHRITVAGGSENVSLFEPRAIDYITKASGGIPRLINTICDRSLLGAYVEGREFVTLAIAKKAAAEITRPGKKTWTLSKQTLVTLICLTVLVVPTSMYFIMSKDYGRQWLKDLLSTTSREEETDAEYKVQDTPPRVTIQPLSDETSQPLAKDSQADEGKREND